MGSLSAISGRVLLFTLAGLAAGLLTWFVSDVSGLIHISDRVGALSARETQGYWIVFMVWGAFIGIALGVVETLLSSGKAEWLKVIGLGALVGIVSGVLGGALGMSLFGPLYVFPAKNPLNFVGNVVARALGWALIGALAGTAAGWRKLSFRVGRNGFIGGLIGGLLGGGTFEIVPYLLVGMARPGVVARLFGFLITGAMIGLFVALVQELLKEAWVKVVVGRNEGKQILIEKERTTIGRSELSDIALFGDATVAKNHAILAASGNRFTLYDTGESPTGTLVNGQRITDGTLVKNGDQIQVGGKLLVFYEKFTKTPTVREARDVAAPRPVPSNLNSLADLPGASTAPPPSYGPPPSSGARGLRATQGPYTGQTFPLMPGAVAGRDASVPIALPADSKASRQHARFVPDGAGWAVEDLNSTNGTYLNGQRITRQPLAPGDTLVIGTTTFRVE